MNGPEARLLQGTRKRFLWICGAFLFIAGALIRWQYFPQTNFDTDHYYRLWLEQFQRFGLAAAFDPATDYNYSVAFACIFTLYAKVFGVANPVMLLKWTGCCLEIVTDGLCLLLLLSLLPKERKATGMLTGLAMLWLNPVLIWNVAAWGQTDIYYLLFSVLSILLLVRERPAWALACLGVALALKLQAVFLLPFYVMVWFCGNKRFALLWFLALPAVFVGSSLPAMLVGENPLATLTVYLGQGELYGGLAMNKYNLYKMIGPVFFSINDAETEMFFRTGLILCLASLGGMIVWLTARKAVVTGGTALLLAAWCVLCCGFLLPRMHERYAIVGEVLLCCWAVWLRKPRGYLYVCAALLPTLGTYVHFLYNASFLDAQVGGAVSFLLLIALTWEVLRETGWQTAAMPPVRKEAVL